MTGKETNAISTRGKVLLYYAISLCCAITVMVAYSSLRQKPVEETITLDPNSRKAPTPPPLVQTNELPTVDRDIETAGDRIAAAVIYLKRRQNEPALDALQEAQAATDRAVSNKPDGSKEKDQLLATRQEIESVKALIRKGKVGYATRELKEVDQQLESVSF